MSDTTATKPRKKRKEREAPKKIGRPSLLDKDRPVAITVKYHPSYTPKLLKAVKEFGSQRKALQGLLDERY